MIVLSNILDHPSPDLSPRSPLLPGVSEISIISVWEDLLWRYIWRERYLISLASLYAALHFHFLLYWLYLLFDSPCFKGKSNITMQGNGTIFWWRTDFYFRNQHGHLTISSLTCPLIWPPEWRHSHRRRELRCSRPPCSRPSLGNLILNLST